MRNSEREEWWALPWAIACWSLEAFVLRVRFFGACSRASASAVSAVVVSAMVVSRSFGGRPRLLVVGALTARSGIDGFVSSRRFSSFNFRERFFFNGGVSSGGDGMGVASEESTASMVEGSTC